MKNREVRFGMISFLQFLFSLLVIMLHCSRLFENDAVHFIQKSIFSRMAVPFFLMSSAFLVTLKAQADSLYVRKYMRKYIQTYLKWSLLFVPYGVLYFLSLSLPLPYLPIALVVGLVYTGICYHLWYSPAYLLGFYLVQTINKRVGMISTSLFFFLLYTIGSIETYSSYLEGSFVSKPYEIYSSIFFTSRNGFFYTPIFICLGILLAGNQNRPLFTHQPFQKVVLSFFFLCIEGVIVYSNQGIDKNFLFGLLPFVLFLLNWSIRTPIWQKFSFQKLKQLSVAYFFIHPVFIEIITNTVLIERFSPHTAGWMKFLFTITCTHVISLALLKYRSNVQTVPAL